MSNIETRLSRPGLLERYNRSSELTYKPLLDLYFSNLTTKIRSPEVPEVVKGRILETMNRNNLMSHILESPVFLDVLKQERLLKGEDLKEGIVICIDGRISIPHQFGRALNVKEIAGSLIDLNEGESTIIDRRFITVLEQSADYGKELLQIVTAHTSLKHKDHRCGRIKVGLDSGEFVGEPDEVALKEAEKRTKAIEKKFNEILIAKGKPSQKKVAITAMVDTDTMGLILNFGQKDKQLSTTELTRDLVSKISQQVRDVGEFGAMKYVFTETKSYIDYSRRVLKITEYLMKNEINDQGSTVKNVSDFIDQNYSDFTSKQKQALLFTVCRTVANQYITGLASEIESKHPYLDHNENYMVVSTSKPFGRFDTQQSFGSAPANREEMLGHVKTKLSLLDKNKGTKPYILFVSTSVNKTVLSDNNATLVGTEDAAKVYFQELTGDKEIKTRIIDGSLVIIPILVDEKNGRILQIRDYSIYLV